MKENLEYLQSLGLTSYQAKTIIVLFSKKEATADELSKFSGIPHTKIYTVLKSLEDRELIYFSPGKPRLFRCNEPTEVINSLIQKMNKKIEWLKETKREQLKKIRTIDLQPIVKENVHPMFAVEATA